MEDIKKEDIRQKFRYIFLRPVYMAVRDQVGEIIRLSMKSLI